ncbi:unnamed protein product [Caenorhabditis brenneri]
MAHHSERSLLKDNNTSEFEANSNIPRVNLCGKVFPVSGNEWNNAGTFQDNVFWQQIQSMGHLQGGGKVRASLTTTQLASETSHTAQECLMKSIPSPHHFSTPLSSNSDYYSTNKTPMVQGSVEPIRKTVLQQLIDVEFQSSTETPKLAPKPRRKYISKRISKKFTPKISQFLIPPSTKIYQENWLNEVYWFHFNEFMKINFYDQITRVLPPKEASPTNQDPMAVHPS